VLAFAAKLAVLGLSLAIALLDARDEGAIDLS
jgi:hypothetical protein